MPVIQLLAHRLNTAMLTLPSIQTCFFSAILLLILAVISLPIGFYFRFLNVEVLPLSWETITKIIIASFVSPAITEEIGFRVLLLPHPTEQASITAQFFWAGISLAIFIVYHPLNALSFFPAGLQTFFHPIFLLLAGCLGIACTTAYAQSGSLWPPVIIHWLVVAVWLVLLGGYGRLNVN